MGGLHCTRENGQKYAYVIESCQRITKSGYQRETLATAHEVHESNCFSFK